ncbi:MAG: Mor transcription activator family protein [bacterium ADurb.Bin236]|nr:MAG: Mor transcription activator family protein [bacterium ADurb.Bin236]
MGKAESKNLPGTYEEFRLLFEPIVGEEKTEELLEAIGDHFGGQQVYLPSFRSLRREKVEKAIRKEFDGSPESLKSLVRKYRLCQGHVRRILANK